MEILTVKANQESGYLVNGAMYVPQAEGNRHYRDIQEWILEGGIVEPFETSEETVVREAVELEAQEWSDYLRDEQVDKKLKWEQAGKPKFKDK